MSPLRALLVPLTAASVAVAAFDPAGTSATVHGAAAPIGVLQDEADPWPAARAVLATRCLPCHGGDQVKGALRFATTRITDFSLRAGPSEAPARDYRRFLQRLDALESGALDAVI